jgi:hypothetical protein
MNRKVQLLLLVVAAVASIFGLAACGSNNNRAPQITVTISSPATSVAINGMLQFTAVVNNTSNTAVTWQVNGTMGGNIATTGSISATGLFQAPAQVPSPATVNVTAISQADNTTTSNTIVVTITATNNTGVVVSPGTPVVPAGGQQIFSATENGNAITPTFTVTSSSASCVAVACLGSFNGATYTAPLSPPPGATVTITATAPDNTMGTTVATIQFSGASLNGQYAFNFSGEDSNGDALDVAGSITMVGSPSSTTVAVTAGLMDIDSLTFGVLQSQIVTGGSFTVGAADGRTSGTIVVGGTTFLLQLTLASNQHGILIDFDSQLGGVVDDTGSGTIDLQPLTGTFSVSSIQGSYSFGLSGADEVNGGLPLSIAGNFTANAGASTQGILDINDGGTANLGGVNPAPDTSLSVIYNTVAIDPLTGRGTISLTSNFLSADMGTPLTFAFYIVDQNHLKLVEIDATAIEEGDAFGAPSGPFTTAALTAGNYAFTLGGIRGSNSIQPFGGGGILASDGNGNIKGGDFDFNDTTPQSSAISATTYTVDPTFGRVNFTLTTGSGGFVFGAYPTSSGSLEMITLDSKTDALGTGFLQSSPVPSAAGNFAINLTGSSVGKNFAAEQDITGEVIASGAALTGTLDINNVLGSGFFPASFPITSGTIPTFDTFGRGTTTIKESGGGSFKLAFYLVSTTSVNDGNAVPTILLVDLDSNRVAVGELDQQF